MLTQYIKKFIFATPILLMYKCTSVLIMMPGNFAEFTGNAPAIFFDDF